MRPAASFWHGRLVACGKLIELSVPPQRAMETSELLRELRIDRDGRPPRLHRRRLLLAAAALVVLAAGLWLAWARTSTPAVRTVVARAATPAGGAGSVLDASGYVTARRQATVSAKITGKVTEVLIEEGMRVREGAVLTRLDDTEAKAQLALARAQLGAARSQDGEIRAQLEQAERDYARSQELFNRKLVAEQAMDAARAQRDTVREADRQPGADPGGDRVGDGGAGAARQYRDPGAVHRHRDRQSCAAGRDDLADLRGRRLHAHRHRHH